MRTIRALLGRSEPKRPAPLPPLQVCMGERCMRAEQRLGDGEGDIVSDGYELVGPRGGRWGFLSEIMPDSWHDAGAYFLPVRGVQAGAYFLPVRGVQRRADVLALPAFAPGQPVSLRPEPDNSYDRHAVGVWDAAGTQPLGYIPKEHAPKIAARAAQYGAFVLREYRDRRTGRRTGIRLVLAPGLSVRATA